MQKATHEPSRPPCTGKNVLAQKFLLGLFVFAIVISLSACAQKAANFDALIANEQIPQIKKELEIAKATLVKEGEDYNCCIKPTCNWCALFDNHCHCGDHIKAGELTVCPECVRGWRKGNGAIEGVESSQVKSALQ